MKCNAEIIAGQVTELADKLIAAEADETILKLFERYKSYFAQFVQIVGAMNENERLNNPSIQKVEEKHKELEIKLKQNKTGIFKEIMNLNSNLSIKQKYYGKKVSRMGVDRKG
jgi:mevalonate kinase